MWLRLDGLDGHESTGVLTMEFNRLASNAADFMEASSCHSRYRVRSEPCTLALRRTPGVNVPGQLSLVDAPNRLVLMNPDSWEHDS